MPNSTIKELIKNNFEGFTPKKLEMWSEEDLPESWGVWQFGYEAIQKFSKAENLEYIQLRNWLCTDTIVGLNAILWNGSLVAFTYQSCRKGDVEWMFIEGSKYTEKDMFDCFMKYVNYSLPKSNCIKEGHAIFNVEVDPHTSYDWRSGPIY